MVKNPKASLSILLLSRISRSLSAGMLAIAFPYLVLNELHQTALFLGSIFAVATFFTAIFGLFFGTITDIWGRKNTLILATLLLPLGSLLLWTSTSSSTLFIAAILGGFSATGSMAGGGIGGSVQPIQNTVLADLAPSEKRTFYYSSFAFINGITAAIGTIFVRFFPTREIFLLAGVISLIGTVILFFMEAPKIKGEIRKLKSKITIGKFTITGLLNGVSQGLITPFLIPFFIIVYRVPETSMSFYALISGTIAATSLLVAPYLDRKFGFVKSITYSRAVSVILLIALPLVKFLPFALLVYIFTPALRVMAVPIQQTAITSLVEESERGRALGINQVIRLGGSSIATEVSAGLFSSMSYIAIPFYMYGVVMAANIYLYKRFFLREEKLKTP